MKDWGTSLSAVTAGAMYAALGLGVFRLIHTLPLWSQKPPRAYRWFLTGIGFSVFLPWYFLYTDVWERHSWVYVPAHVTLSFLGLAWLFVVLGSGFLAKHVFVPLGWVRCAFYTGRLAKRSFAQDPLGGGLLCGVVAALQHGNLHPQDLSFLQQQALRISLRGAGLVAHVLLTHAVEGKTDGLQPLLKAISLVDSRAFPPWARCISVLWQMAYAGNREDWTEVYRLGEELGAARNRRVRLWQQVAQCFLQSPQERRPWRLWMAFWRAGRPHGFTSLIQRALEAPEPTPKAVPVSPELRDMVSQSSSFSWRQALTVQFTVQRAGSPSVQQIQKVIAGWNEAWDHSTLTDFIQARCITLGLVNRGFREQFLAQVITYLRSLTQSLPLEELAAFPGICNERLVAETRHCILTEFEAHCQALRDRTQVKRALPLWEEWREWGRQQQAYETLKRNGGAAVREVAWPLFHTEITRWAVWLWNERNECVLGNTMFRYLWIEALLIKDEQASGLQERNLRCNWE